MEMRQYIVLVLALIGVIGARSANMTPIAITGFNRDVVVENTSSGPPYTTALNFNQGENSTFYQNGLSGKSYGLPASGTFTSALGDGTVFQFQNYAASNALVLSGDTGITNGTLTLVTPATYSRICVIANSGNGTSGNGTLRLRFSDNSLLVTNYYAPDWFNDPTSIAIQGFERIDLTTGATSGATTNPRFYQTTINLAAALGTNNKPLVSLSFDKPLANSTGIYAVSGLAVSLSTNSFSLAVITNLPAANIQTTTAVLNGQVLSTGGDVPTLTLYYSVTDGGTNVGSWSQSITVGPQSGSFTQAISGLSFGTTYYFTAKAVNGAGTTWAAPSQSFTTVAPSLATITNLPASSVQGASASLNGQVLSTGGDTPNVTLYYGPMNGGTSAAAWSNNIPAGSQTGIFAQTILGLTTNTTYYFTAQAVNGAGTTWATPASFFTTLGTNPVQRLVAVLTYHNSNDRLGANTNEGLLTLANVNTNSFGKMFTYTVDGFVYAQPLILTNVSIPGKGVHNVVFIATEHESVYAFDADSNAGTNASPLWQTSFLINGATTVPAGDVGTSDITPEIGITSTPVIGFVTIAGVSQAVIYVESKTKEAGAYVHRLHALDTTSGAEMSSLNSPVIIAATNYPGVGTGDNDGAGHVLWNPMRELNRPALALLNGNIYIAYASHGDNGPYHGWLFQYSATNLTQQLSVYNATPNGGLGGFWQGGGGPAIDAAGNLYLMTGNGSFNATGGTFNPLTNNFAMSALKFSTTNGISLTDYFTPFNQASLSGADSDLGSGAPIVLPDSAGSAAHPHLLVVAGKSGMIYLVDRDIMGRFNSANDSQIVQSFSGLAPGGQNGNYATPAYFNNLLYFIGMNDSLRAFRMTNGTILTTPVLGSTTFGAKASSSPSISANGTNNAILWMIESEGQNPAGPAILRAYNATNVAQELYNSSQIASRDNPGTSVKFTVPTIANGKVYVGAQYALSVFGAGVFLATPVISPNGGIFTNSATVTLTDATLGTTIYYTLDNSVPTTNSLLYTSPFVLLNNANVQAFAVKIGAVNSGVASATFLNSSAIGTGTGLRGAYWSNTTSTAFTNISFNAAPTLVRTDSVVNFNWGNGSPDPSISTDTFVARWNGAVQPQFSETYTIYTTTDDGVRVWVNGQLLINHWADQGPTEWSGSITLAAQQRYNIQMDYYENGGSASATLSWSSPSTTKAIIPQSQLYPLTNPPPVVILNSPASGATYTAAASVTIGADAGAQYNTLNRVDFYVGSTFVGSVSNIPYTVTATGLAAGSYALTAIATDGSGLSSTSAPVNITVNSGTGQPYGLTNRGNAPAFLNMPTTFAGALPLLLSQTGAFTNTSNLGTVGGLIPYNVNTPLWSDAALKSRWLVLPNSGAPYTTDEQIGFATNGEWSFPAGSVFVKHFDLVTNEITGGKRRLETRLIVRDAVGAAYGVTYKWRADNSEADLLTTSLDESIAITNAGGGRTQVWHYPSPAECLQCHTASAGYVLGVKTRQLNGSLTYPSTGAADNQLRTFNRLGLFNPAIDESAIAGYAKLSSLTNLSASLEERSRSYIDANCAQCHRPGGNGPTIDARYDTPLASQNIINAILAKGDLGYDNARVVVPQDVWRSILYQRTGSLDASVKMPPLARNLVDTNAMSVLAAWINSLAGTPALAPPTVTPNGSVFFNSVNVSLQSTNGGDALYYTMDGSLPGTNSLFYAGPFTVASNTTVKANAFKAGFNNSVAATALFTLHPPVVFTAGGIFTNNIFQMQVSGVAGKSYFLQGSTNLINWISLGAKNTAISNLLYLSDPNATNFTQRFYRAIELP